MIWKNYLASKRIRSEVFGRRPKERIPIKVEEAISTAKPVGTKPLQPRH